LVTTKDGSRQVRRVTTRNLNSHRQNITDNNCGLHLLQSLQCLVQPGALDAPETVDLQALIPRHRQREKTTHLRHALRRFLLCTLHSDDPFAFLDAHPLSLLVE